MRQSEKTVRYTESAAMNCSVIHDITDYGIEKVLKRIEKCRVKYNEENNVNLDFAKGVSLYTEGDTTFENLVARADAEMYRDKRLTKKGRRDDYE